MDRRTYGQIHAWKRSQCMKEGQNEQNQSMAHQTNECMHDSIYIMDALIPEQPSMIGLASH